MADLEASLTDIGWLSSKLHPAIPEEKSYNFSSKNIIQISSDDLVEATNCGSSMQLIDDPNSLHSNDIVSSSTPLEKPGHSYANLIAMAIRSSPQFKITLSEIYAWISETFPFYKQAGPGWKNSIRHNLSLNKCFIKLERSKAETGKGSYWTICEEILDEPGAIRVKQKYKTSPYYLTQKSDSEKTNGSNACDYNNLFNSLSSAPVNSQVCNNFNTSYISSTSESDKKNTLNSNQIIEDFSFVGLRNIKLHPENISLADTKIKSTNPTREDYQLNNSKYKPNNNEEILCKSREGSFSSNINNFKCQDNLSNPKDLNFLNDGSLLNMNTDDSFIDSAVDLDSSFGYILNSVLDDNDTLLGSGLFRNNDWLKNSLISASNTKWDNIDLTQFPTLAESIHNADFLNWNLNEKEVMDMAASLNEFFRLQQNESNIFLNTNFQCNSNYDDHPDSQTINDQGEITDLTMPILSPQITSCDEIEDDFDWDKIV